MWKKQSGFRVQTSLPIIHHRPTHHSCALQFIHAYPTLAQEWPVHYRGPATTKRGYCNTSSKSSPKVGVFQGTVFFILSYLYHRFLHVDDQWIFSTFLSNLLLSICLLERKLEKAGSFQSTTHKNHNIENTFIVQGFVESFNVEYRLFTINQLITSALCSSFKHIQPQLKNGLYIIGGLGHVTTKRRDQDMSSKSSPKVGVFQRTFFFCIVIFIRQVLACGQYQWIFSTFSLICTQNLAKSS